MLALVPYLILRGLVNRWGAKRMNLTDTSDPRSVVLPPAFLQVQRTKHSTEKRIPCTIARRTARLFDYRSGRLRAMW